jgi:hypothetical protein
MPATIVTQTAAPYTNATGGSENIGPFSTVGLITPLRTYTTLVAGNNAFTVPANAVGCIIIPPTTNTVVLTYKGTTGSGGTVALTTGATIVTAVAIGAAGTGYPASTTFLASPTQSGGSGCLFAVTTNGSGVPTAVTFIAGVGGTGYSNATVPWTLGDQGVNIPKAAPAVFFFDQAVIPTTIYVNAASLTTGTTTVLFF